MIKTSIIAVMVCAVISCNRPTTAQTFLPPHQFSYGKPTLHCVKQESSRYNIPLEVALAINSIERGKTGQAVQNSDGTNDLGAFQINSIHLDMVRERFGGSRQDLLERGCFNAHVAMYLLNKAIHEPKKSHLDYYTRVAGYHSWTPKHNETYRKKLIPFVGQWRQWLAVNPV